MKKSNTSERLKLIMSKKNLRQVDILELTKPYSEKYGVRLEKNDLSQYVSGKYDPKQDKLSVLAKALNVSETWLMGYDVPSSPNIRKVTMHKIPKLGCTAAGIPHTREYDGEDYVEVSQDIQADYCLDIKGDSMEPLVQDGDVVFLRQQDCVDNGEIAVVMINGEATLKKFYKYEHQIHLIPLNLKYPPIIIDEKDAEDLRIVGKALYFCRNL